MMRKFMVYLDTDEYAFNGCIKEIIPAKSEDDAIRFCQGNSEVIKVKDVTKDYPISVDKVYEALEKANFGQAEISLITRCLVRCDIAD